MDKAPLVPWHEQAFTATALSDAAESAIPPTHWTLQKSPTRTPRQTP
jgi:hypothetical protein